MNIDRTEIYHLLCESVAEVNEQLPPDKELALAEDTSLLPGSSGLDSLATVNLQAAIEERLETRLGSALSLAEETEFAEGVDPWSSIGSLADFLATRIRQRGDGEADGV